MLIQSDLSLFRDVIQSDTVTKGDAQYNVEGERLNEKKIIP